jgi:hypothetical protein
MPAAVKLREAISEILAPAAILKSVSRGVDEQSQPMTEITSFVALPFDFIDGGVTAGERIDCRSDRACASALEGIWPRWFSSVQPHYRFRDRKIQQQACPSPIWASRGRVPMTKKLLRFSAAVSASARSTRGNRPARSKGTTRQRSAVM